MDMWALAMDLNDWAERYRIGGLQRLRVELRGLLRSPGTAIFSEKSIKDDFIFHHGGRKELQFNVGIDDVGGEPGVRHGVAFSFEPSQTLPDISVLCPLVDRFNYYVTAHREVLTPFRMWHWGAVQQGKMGLVRPIETDLIRPNVFVFAGDWVPLSEFEADWEASLGRILRDFDQLLPLYTYVMSDLPHALPVPSDDFRPGHTPRTPATSTHADAREISIALTHNCMQDFLYLRLCERFGAENVGTEHSVATGGRVDAAVRTATGKVFYEIKVTPCARTAIREAMGQLLEYAHWPASQRAEELVVVGQAPPDENAKAYLETLRTTLKLPVWYQRLEPSSGVLDSRV